MPSNWAAVDTNFPTFTGDEPLPQQIHDLHNYMFVLTEQLRYSLANLNASNWNATALQDLQDGATAAIVQQVNQLTMVVNALLGQIGSLQGRIASLSAENTEQGEDIQLLQTGYAELQAACQALSGQVQELETDVAGLLKEQEEAAQRLDALETGQEELAGRMDEMEAGVQVTVLSDGSTKVDLTGVIYINGILFEGGTSA